MLLGLIPLFAIRYYYNNIHEKNCFNFKRKKSAPFNLINKPTAAGCNC